MNESSAVSVESVAKIEVAACDPNVQQSKVLDDKRKAALKCALGSMLLVLGAEFTTEEAFATTLSTVHVTATPSHPGPPVVISPPPCGAAVAQPSETSMSSGARNQGGGGGLGGGGGGAPPPPPPSLPTVEVRAHAQNCVNSYANAFTQPSGVAPSYRLLNTFSLIYDPGYGWSNNRVDTSTKYFVKPGPDWYSIFAGTDATAMTTTIYLNGTTQKPDKTAFQQLLVTLGHEAAHQNGFGNGDDDDDGSNGVAEQAGLAILNAYLSDPAGVGAACGGSGN